MQPPPKLDVNGPMVFTPFAGCGTGNGCGEDVYLLADGVIQPNSVELLKSVIAKVQSLQEKDIVYGDVTDICFNSPGGDLDGALALGQYIREAKLDTCVYDRYMLEDKEQFEILSEEDVKSSPSFDKTNISFDNSYVYRINTQCSSACVFAFIGGLDRNISLGDEPPYKDTQKTNIGVHQISGAMGNVGDGPTQNQIARLNKYVSEMGVDHNLVDTVISTPSESITFLSFKTIKQLNLLGSSVGDREVVENQPSWDIFVDDSSKPYAKIKWQDINHITGEMKIFRVNDRPSLEMRYTYIDSPTAKEALEVVFLSNKETPTVYVEVNGERIGYEIRGAQWHLMDGNTIAMQGGVSLNMIRSLEEGEKIGTDLWYGAARFLAPLTELPLQGLPKLLPVVLN
jgi:hypothetical protein